MSSAPQTVVETIDLRRKYKRGKIEIPALQGIDMTIGKGEIIGITGPSGSGKTTLISMIGGLDRPTHGQVIVDGQDLNDLDDTALTEYRLKKIGFVFQFYNLIPTLTALENIELPMSLANVPEEEQKKRAIELLSTVDLGMRANHKPDELSGGEQQRVAVARALANDPSVILADEPTGDLDSKSAKRLMELIKTLQKERRVTFVLVTHDPLVVAQCHRAYAIRDGKIVHEFSGKELGKIMTESLLY